MLLQSCGKSLGFVLFWFGLDFLKCRVVVWTLTKWRVNEMTEIAFWFCVVSLVFGVAELGFALVRI